MSVRVIYLDGGGSTVLGEVLNTNFISGWYPHTAILCPVCGQLWARVIPVEYTKLAGTNHGITWFSETRRCAEHGDGTLLREYDTAGANAALLQRELLILMEREK